MADSVKIILKGGATFNVQGDKKTVTRAMYSWTKYGGGNKGLYSGDLQNEWTCQTCGEKQVKALTPYMFEFVPREYLSICSICHSITLRQKITSFQHLITIVRTKGSYNVELE